MTRETKVGLLVGMGVILLIGIIVSDHLSMAQKQSPPDMTDYAQLTQSSLNARGTGLESLPVTPAAQTPAPPAQALPTPAQMASSQATPAPSQPQAAMASSTVDRAEAASPASSSSSPDASRLAQAPQASVSRPAAALAAAPGFDQAALASSVRIAPRPTQGPQPAIHYVQRGDTLYNIASRYYNNGELWRIIRQANPDVVKTDNSVNFGDRLVIPNKALLPELLREQPDAAAVLAPVLPAPDQGRARQQTVVVRQGDTLSGLAAKYLGSSGRWNELLRANSDKLDSARDLRVGMTIVIPGHAATTAARSEAAAVPQADQPRYYVVQAGDTLIQIAQDQLGDSGRYKAIFEANRDQLKNENALRAGMKLRLPSRQ